MSWTFHTIGVIESPCKEKFGVPRQSSLVPELQARIVMQAPYDRVEAFDQLESFSHIWVLSVFHQAMQAPDQWQATVRPPRLGGNQRVGVFASRSPYRPNPIALSVFRLIGIEQHNKQLTLHVSGCDLVDGTPVLDIKPYVPYADKVEEARTGYVEAVTKPILQVVFDGPATEACAEIESLGYPGFGLLVERLIAQDPRPAYHEDAQQKVYGIRVYDYNVRFHVSDGLATVTQIE
jgi:tRNA-Thr(GGU) m(6)t(6)A37 methyltransferase TsaA